MAKARTTAILRGFPVYKQFTKKIRFFGINNDIRVSGDLLKDKKLKNHILKKAKKNQPLTAWEQKFNKLVGKVRFKVERTFGSVKRWFSGGTARYKGLEKMHTQNLIEAMCYNLYRSPGIIASNCKN